MEKQCGMAKFLPPAKKQNQIEQVPDLDDLSKDAMKQKMSEINNTGIYPWWKNWLRR